jgi:hypothetical protein
MIQVKRELKRATYRRMNSPTSTFLGPRVSLTNTDNSSVGSVGSVSDQVIGEYVNDNLSLGRCPDARRPLSWIRGATDNIAATANVCRVARFLNMHHCYVADMFPSQKPENRSRGVSVIRAITGIPADVQFFDLYFDRQPVGTPV